MIKSILLKTIYNLLIRPTKNISNIPYLNDLIAKRISVNVTFYKSLPLHPTLPLSLPQLTTLSLEGK